MLLATITVVLANVGNVNVPACNDQVFKLCQRAVEERAAEAFTSLRPDITGLIEVLPPDLCERAPSPAPTNLCSGLPEPPSQVTRLLGADAEHGCDQRYGWDCLAVRRGGPLRFGGRLSTRPVRDECSDDGFTLSTAVVRYRGWPFTVAVAHPDSSDVPCRTAQLGDLFDAALPGIGPVLVLGDLNVDFYREQDASAELMRTVVPRRLQALSSDAFTSFPGAPSQLDPTGTTLDNGVFLPSGPLGPRSIDHVLARRMTGTCEVQRVDGGGGMDHRAQVCEVVLGQSVAPRALLDRSRCRVAVTFAREDVVGVKLRAGGRARTDRRPPFDIRAGRARRLRVRALTLVGPGPWVARPLGPCARGATESVTSPAAR